MKAIRANVAQQAAHQLTRLGMVLKCRQVAGADQQLARADFGFEEQAQLVIAGEVVNDMDDRAVVRRGCVQNDGAGVFRQAPPLPVAVKFGGELRQCGMFRVSKETQGAWRRFEFALLGGFREHRPAPEVGLEGALYAMLEFVMPGEQEDLAGTSKMAMRRAVQAVGDHYVAGHAGVNF